MKLERQGQTWKVYCDPTLASAVPGLWTRNMPFSGPVDAAAVLAKRGGISGVVPRPEDYYTPTLKHQTTINGLRDYQLAGVRRVVGTLQAAGGFILADDMGLGKTVQTLATWEMLGRPGPLLICAPASVRLTWRDQIKRWLGIDATIIKTGAQAAKVDKSVLVAVTSYDLVKKLSSTFSPKMLVLDEAHLLRGRVATRSNALLDLAKVVTYTLALTGTPIWSRPRDFWMLLKILYGYRFGTADEFDYAYCGAYMNQWGGKENKGISRPDELRLRLGYVMLRRTKEEVASELPPLTRVVRWVPAVKAATKALEAFALGQLHFADALNATLDSKVEAAVEAAASAGRFLLFTWQKRHAEQMYSMLNESGVTCEILTGDYTETERQAAIQRAKKSGASVVATIDSSGTGVDGLQEIADTAIFHALDYVPIKMAQAEARLHRIGQKNPVTVVYIALEDSADQMVINTVVDKLDQWKATMGGDSTARMGDAIGAPVGAADEQAALTAIYAAMRDD